MVLLFNLVTFKELHLYYYIGKKMAEDSAEIVKEQVEATAANGVATISNGAPFFTNQLFALSINSASGWAGISQSIAGKVSESIIHTSPSEGVNAQLMTALAIKNQQSTAPLTAAQLVPGQG